MRKSFLIAATILALSIQTRGQQSQSPQEQPPPQSAGQASQKPSALAEAARKAREQKKNEPKPAKIFDNDNLPAQGGISSVGQATKAPADAGQTAGGGAAAAPAGSNEKAWRARFAGLRHKLDQDQQDLDIMQRELGVLDVQYYSDPVKGMQQQLTRSDINQKTAKIEAKKKQIEADKQAIADAEDELRRSGGDPGWAR